MLIQGDMSDEEYADVFYKRAGFIAQEIMDESEAKYSRKEGAAIVSLSLLMCAVCLARDVSKGKCTKVQFLQKASELWDALSTAKRSALH